jgi:short chain dehydrogenase
MTLQGKTALVTRGIPRDWRATALALAEAGARVVIHYGKSASDAESVVASIRAQGGLADAIPADLATPNGANVLANEVRKILADRLDILVANAGVSKRATLPDHTNRRLRQSFRHKRTRPVLPDIAACACARTGGERRCDFISWRPERRWQARSGQSFALSLRLDQRRHRNARQELGCAFWPEAFT